MFKQNLLLVLAFITMSAASLHTQAAPFPFGATGTGGSDTGWGSRAVCYFGEFPPDVAAALTNPGGAAAFEFNVTFSCKEQNGSECPAAEEGIKADLAPDDDGFGAFVFNSDGTIVRYDGGSFLTDGFATDMRIRIAKTFGINDGNFTVQSVTADTLTVNEPVTEYGTPPDDTVAAKIFSPFVTLSTLGNAPCVIVSDDGDFYASQTPQPVMEFDLLVYYTDIDRVCDDAGTCTGKAYVTDPGHQIYGVHAAPDGTAFAMHGCEAGSACKVCVRNPDSLKSRDRDNFYAAIPPYEYAQSVMSVSDSTAYFFDARNPSSGPVITSEEFSTPATQAELDAAIESCASEPVAFKIQGTDTDSTVSADGIIELAMEFESETLNVVNNTVTAKVKSTYDLPQNGYTCDQITEVYLEGVPPVDPPAELGNKKCVVQFNKTAVVDALRVKRPFVDGETRTLISTGKLDDSGTELDWRATDTVTITENYNETVQFATSSSQSPEGVAHTVDVQVQGDLSGPVYVDVVDTKSGTARSGTKKDYTFTNTVLTFEPGGESTQSVSVNINVDNAPDAGETIILQLTNLSGPASLGNIVTHTITTQ